MTLRSLRGCASIVLAAMLAALTAGASACGGGQPPPPSCPNDVPRTCPSPAPTYTAVSPILQARCGACHAPGGVEQVRPFQRYDQVKPQTMDIFLSVSACIMPPADQTQPTSEERQAILGWIICGAMDD